MKQKEKKKYLKDVYRSDRTPNPGPFGGAVREVSPPAGSQEKRPFLPKIKHFSSLLIYLNYVKITHFYIFISSYLGPGGGTLPALSSSIIFSISFGVRSSWGCGSKNNICFL